MLASHLGAGGSDSGGFMQWNAPLGGEPLHPPWRGLPSRRRARRLLAITGAWEGEPGTIHYFARHLHLEPMESATRLSSNGRCLTGSTASTKACVGKAGTGGGTGATRPRPLDLPTPRVRTRAPSERTRGAVPAREMWYFVKRAWPAACRLPPGAGGSVRLDRLEDRGVSPMTERGARPPKAGPPNHVRAPVSTIRRPTGRDSRSDPRYGVGPRLRGLRHGLLELGAVEVVVEAAAGQAARRGCLARRCGPCP